MLAVQRCCVVLSVIAHYSVVLKTACMNSLYFRLYARRGLNTNLLLIHKLYTFHNAL